MSQNQYADSGDSFCEPNIISIPKPISKLAPLLRYFNQGYPNPSLSSVKSRRSHLSHQVAKSGFLWCEVGAKCNSPRATLDFLTFSHFSVKTPYDYWFATQTLLQANKRVSCDSKFTGFSKKYLLVKKLHSFKVTGPTTKIAPLERPCGTPFFGPRVDFGPFFQYAPES